MKIITKGEIPKQKLPAWVGLMMTCGICKTVFELEEDDYPDIIKVRSRSIFHKDCKVTVQCPFCKAEVSATVCLSKV